VFRRTLVVGFGNPFRRDDGVGAAVANALLVRLGREPLGPLDDGFDGLGQQVDVIQVHQLVPELSETVAGYDLLILVDAHLGAIKEPVVEQSIAPFFRAPLVAHQTQPSSVLALSQQMHGTTPEGVLMSLRGHDFGFGEGLSPQTAALVPGVVGRIVEMIQSSPV
jgi:hydrogenase maturation protease